ncbi:MAG: methyltransferase domain-containing protein [Betaproteobacteria bacterium]
MNYGRHLIGSFLESSRPFSQVVDLGAGHGTDLTIAKGVQPDAQFFGVEVYPPYALELQNAGFNVIAVDIERDALPFDDGTIDIVIANQILEHTKDVFWIFHQVARTLRRGGSLILGVPNLASLHNRLLLALGNQPSPIKTASAHVRGFTKRDILSFTEQCFPGGFALRNFGGSNFYPFPSALARPLARALPNMAWGIFLRIEKVRDYNNEFVQFPVKARLETNFYLGPSA